MLDEEVKYTKSNEAWRREYMKEIADRMDVEQAGIRQGIAQGIIQGEQRINKLIVLLAEQNRSEELIKAAKDEAYRKLLFEEFRL